jgi:hypothetical protein
MKASLIRRRDSKKKDHSITEVSQNEISRHVEVKYELTKTIAEKV